MLDFFEFQLRPPALYKIGLAGEIGHESSNLGAQRALIVTDTGVLSAGLIGRTRDGISGSIEIAGLFSEITPNSSVAMVEHGAAYAREQRADLLIAIGGGSAIDTAKAMRILISEGGNLRDYEGYNLLNRALVPMI